MVDLNYDAASNAHLTMQNGSTGDSGDKYTGLDRFGRLVETIWKTSSAEQVHTKYGRNRLGGVVWQNNVKAHASSVATQDNYYWYDGLQQVTRHDRGDLTPSSGPPYTGIDPTTRQQQEDFTFDQTGNWTAFQTTSPSLAQTRTHDTANQIASLTNPSGVIQPVYDELGNMTTMPKAGDWTANISLKWDAWNRLVQFNEGSAEIAYRYDALSRRTLKENTNVPEFRHYYYDRQWRSVEERVEGATHTVDCQFVWSPIDRWTLIRRKRSTSSSLDETRFVLKDYLDPAAIIDSSAAVDERFGYDAFGQVNLMTPAFATRTTSVCDWNFLFHAEFIDSDSGLYNYGYRYYHTNLGRWLSRDPIGEEGGLNLYAFVGNDPLGWFDDLGKEPKQQSNDQRVQRNIDNSNGKNSNKTSGIANRANNGSAATDEAACQAGNVASAAASLPGEIIAWLDRYDKLKQLVSVEAFCDKLAENAFNSPIFPSTACKACCYVYYSRDDSDPTNPQVQYSYRGGNANIVPGPCDLNFRNKKYAELENIGKTTGWIGAPSTTCHYTFKEYTRP